MSKNINRTYFLAAMVVVIVVMDFLFFRHHFRDRLIANIAVAVIFLLFYLVILKLNRRS